MNDKIIEAIEEFELSAYDIYIAGALDEMES